MANSWFSLITIPWLQLAGSRRCDVHSTTFLARGSPVPSSSIPTVACKRPVARSGYGASASIHGKFEDPGHPMYNFAREVDFCSGVCLMIPQALFQRCGGFDTRYDAASYGDADLAFKVRHSGHKVIYQPLASVIYQENLTLGTRTGKAVKSPHEVNQERFRQRWRERLAAHAVPSEEPLRVVHGTVMTSSLMDRFL